MARATTQMMDQAAAALHQVGVTVNEDFDMDDLAEEASWLVDPYCALSFGERCRLANGVVHRLSTYSPSR